MPLVPAKCPECGGLVEVDNEKRAGMCQHCNQPFVIEDAIQTFNTYYQTTNNYNTTNNTTHNYGDGAVVNVYESQNKDFEIVGGVLKKYTGESVDVVIPDNVQSVEEGAFAEAKNLKTLTIPETVESLKLCALPKLENLCYLGTFEKWVSSYFLANYSGNNSFHIYIGNQPINNDSINSFTGIIPAYAFAHCADIKGAITIPDSIVEVKACAFTNCNSLESINLNKVEKLGEMAFSHCIQLKEANCGNVTEIASMTFSDCNSLRIVNLNKVREIGDYAFSNCVGLENINLGPTEKIGKCAFFGCNNLTEIIVNNPLDEMKRNIIDGTKVEKIVFTLKAYSHENIYQDFDERFHIKEVYLDDRDEGIWLSGYFVDKLIIPDNYDSNKCFINYATRFGDIIIGNNVVLNYGTIKNISANNVYVNGKVRVKGKALEHGAIYVKNKVYVAPGVTSISGLVNRSNSYSTCPICGGSVGLSGKCHKCKVKVD